MNKFYFELNCDEMPNGWENQTIYTYEGPTADNFKHRLTITVDRHLPGKDPSFGRCVAEREATLLGSLGKVEVVKKEDILLINTFQSRALQIKWCIAPNVIRQLQYYFLVDGDRFITFSCMYTDKSIIQLSGDVRTLIEYLLGGVKRPAEPLR